MTGTKNQDNNIENFVRENTRMIVQQSIDQPNSGNRHYRIYKCKDCDKEYDNFQALGGHRASHRNTKPQTLNGESSGSGVHETQPQQKLHVCKICKKGFEIGQSLGGHMRKHWRKVKTDADGDSSFSSCSSSSSAILSESNGELTFKYDLNLTPRENECVHGVEDDQDSSESS